MGSLQHVLLAFLLLWTPHGAALGVGAALARAELAAEDPEPAPASTMDQQVPCLGLAAVWHRGPSPMPRETDAGSVQTGEQLMGGI